MGAMDEDRYTLFKFEKYITKEKWFLPLSRFNNMTIKLINCPIFFVVVDDPIPLGTVFQYTCQSRLLLRHSNILLQYEIRRDWMLRNYNCSFLGTKDSFSLSIFLWRHHTKALAMVIINCMRKIMYISSIIIRITSWW